jgi:Arc/MetJ-type ribon-helix-helix transcriptional regulator
MTIDLKPEQQRIIDLAIQSGAYHNPDEVISTALSMLAEDIEDGAVSEVRSMTERKDRTRVPNRLKEGDS